MLCSYLCGGRKEGIRFRLLFTKTSIHVNLTFTFHEVLYVVVVDLPCASVTFDQIVLGAAQVDLTVLHTMKRTH